MPLKSTLGGSEVFVPALVVSNEAPTPINPSNVDTTRNQGQESVSMNVSPDQGPYTCVDTTAYLSRLSGLSGISRTPDVVQHHEQRARRQKFKKTGNKLPVASSRTSRRLAGTGGTPKSPYSCSFQGCSKKYAQRQGLRLHYREKHVPSLCMHCGVFKWGRPYRLRKHIEKEHPDVDLDAALDKATETSSRIITGQPQQQWVSPFTPEHEQWGCAESQPYPLKSSLPIVTKLPPISLPHMSPAVYGPHTGPAGPTIKKKRKNEDAPQSEALNTTYPRIGFPFTEECAQRVQIPEGPYYYGPGPCACPYTNPTCQ